MNLFAEQLPPDFRVIESSEEFVEQDRVIFLQVPLSLPKRFPTQQFQKILNQYHEGRRGIRNNRVSTAKYPVVGHVDRLALEKCLRVYDMKVANPKMHLWDIAQQCKVVPQTHFVLNDGTQTKRNVSDKKLVLANAASRLLKRAQRIINATSSGQFPAEIGKE